MNKTFNRIRDRISNRHWDGLRERMRLPLLPREVRDRVWGVVSTRVWTRLARGGRNVPRRIYRRFP